MKKVLFTGGSHSALPMIEAAKAKGYYVITTGNDEDSIGHRTADKYVKGDFSDKDFVLDLAKRESVDAIVSGPNDFAYISTAYACEKLGLPGHDTYETAKTIHIKDRFRAVTESIGIRTPKIRKCSDTDECIGAAKEIGFPLLVKPVDLTGGKGVRVCTEMNEAVDAFNDAMKITREDHVILEQFIEGTPHGFTSLIKDGRVVFHIFDNEQYGINKYLVLGASSPSDITQHAEFTLINDIEKLAKHCDLVDGLFHTQFIVDETGYPVMIDPCRRAPGDLYVLLAKYVTGVDYPAEIVNAECGGDVKDSYICEHNYVARECIMTDRKGRIRDVVIDDELKPFIVHTYMEDYRGVDIEEPMKYKAGILVMKFDSYDKMTDIVDRFSKLVRIEFED